MKKVLAVAVVCGAACGVMAQDAAVQQMEEKEQEIKVVLSADLNSAYVFRGAVVNNEAVLQPQVEVSTEMCSGIVGVRAWANHDLTSNGSRFPESGDSLIGLTEVDYTLFYASAYEDFDYEVGVIRYDFPEDHDFDTWEVYGTTEYNACKCFVPFASVYFDLEEYEGWYVNGGAYSDMEVSDALTTGVSADIGYGSRQHNKGYYGSDNNALADLNLKAYSSYAISEKLSAGAQVVYTQLLDNGVRRDDPDSEIIWGGVNLSYAF
jgi:hypothetical protein